MFEQLTPRLAASVEVVKFLTSTMIKDSVFFRNRVRPQKPFYILHRFILETYDVNH